jgi:PTH1 family peptidyl-tRNA hydrolase
LSAALKLVVGLGNPGAEYAETRHNVGFWFCERLADQLKTSFGREARYHGWAAHARADGIWLLLPATYMNESGRAVQALARFFRIEPAEMLVVHDDLDLLPGRTQLRFGGGLGGHNGLKSLTAHLGTQDYWRLRVGIGRPAGEGDDVVNYVLKPPRREEREEIDAALDRALLAWPQLAQAGFDAAMRKINIRPAPKKETP